METEEQLIVKRTINLDDYFQPRSYQMPILDAFNKGYKRILSVLPRRAGKDLTCWNLMIEQAMKKPAIYWYILPSYSQARKVIWNGKLIDGRSFLDCIPKEVIYRKREQEMSITLINGSLIQVLGSSDIDRLMGSNPYGIVFSEYAMTTDTRVFPLLLPILRASGGWCIFISTPRGKNNFYDLYQIASQNSDSWFCYKLSVEDTKHISVEEINKDIESGAISYDMAQQEYWCSFDMGISGAVYGTALDRMRENDQITNVPWLPEYPVHTVWDIGNEGTAICFFQQTKTLVHIIDYYEKSLENIEHYMKVIQDKPYNYGKHFFPHDMGVKDFVGPKYSRYFKAKRMGLGSDAVILDRVSLEDGIECTRASLSNIYIDEKKCLKLIKCLENYRYEWDDKRQVYLNKPIHNWASHGADSLRYLCLSLPKTKDGMSAEDARKLREQALYGSGSNMPPFFRT